MVDSITNEAASFGWLWLVLAVISAPLVAYPVGRALVRWLGPVTSIIVGLIVASGLGVIARLSGHDEPWLVMALAAAPAIWAEAITPRLGRGLRSLWGAIIKRGSGGGGLPPAAGGE